MSCGLFLRRLDFSEERSVIAPVGARAGRVWPTGFAFDDEGKVWVLSGANDLINGDVLIYQNNNFIQRANTDDVEAFDPVDIAFLGSSRMMCAVNDSLLAGYLGNKNLLPANYERGK